ncbi:MAG: rhomboid family intramembrane serine protease [Ignavibacteria bacterium RIFOXYB2_FULL_35_12]|nr:MAG: rhomboid family intramembrane serine protease [Ignavibacteria bacterium GWA2_36_19]OGU49632.1 MAG: rhomboid family intramembrane serine protease [Ignavibacteria bacterium GWC2_35_8]OGU62210.1 MAG: rhomboid family intramembrane serine protease [Ignavibacteria bacterium GWF2_35_20]OGU81077.1 MAG: rhomboid family intramembrane serine protease [Ignavibacteria bacterium RIFOXYA2_FULL_35_9]OGU84616.1 MAG: rhomboid family intramembrane serine protease [Ignavibacteria bacterium RIFOXYA12_FULL_3
MLMPIGDDNSDRRLKPLINYLLIAANIFVFIFFQGLGTNEKFTYAFSTVPEEIVSGKDVVTEDQMYEDPVTGERFRVSGLQPTPISVYITLITSMFMHGGFTHIFGNMLFLMIFGDNIENRLGHLRYLIFYLLVGIIASLAHVFVSVSLGSSTLIPSLGASGAISGVLGGYLLLFPKRRVRVVMFYQIMVVPAIVAIGIWFAFQLINGIGILGSSQGGGVAYGAHIGGFIAGLFLIKFFAIGRR